MTLGMDENRTTVVHRRWVVNGPQARLTLRLKMEVADESQSPSSSAGFTAIGIFAMQLSE